MPTVLLIKITWMQRNGRTGFFLCFQPRTKLVSRNANSDREMEFLFNITVNTHVLTFYTFKITEFYIHYVPWIMNLWVNICPQKKTELSTHGKYPNRRKVTLLCNLFPFNTQLTCSLLLTWKLFTVRILSSRDIKRSKS